MRWVSAAIVRLLLTGFLWQGFRLASVPAVRIVSWNVITDDGW